MSNMQVSCLSKLISRTMASCFPGASTSVMCPMFRRCMRSFSCLVWRLLQSSDTLRSRAEWSPFVLKGAWYYRGNPGLSLLSCDSLQIEFICVHWNFVRKHLASRLCRRLLRSFVTPVKQPMASSSVRPTYSMRCQRCLFADACTWMFAGDFLWRTGNCHEYFLAHSQCHNGWQLFLRTFTCYLPVIYFHVMLTFREDCTKRLSVLAPRADLVPRNWAMRWHIHFHACLEPESCFDSG